MHSYDLLHAEMLGLNPTPDKEIFYFFLQTFQDSILK
jgi:hypothetical protein